MPTDATPRSIEGDLHDNLLGPAHRWCDRRCERCLFSERCDSALEGEAAPPLSRDENQLRRAAIDHATSVLTLFQGAVNSGKLVDAVAAPPIADAFAIAARVAPLVEAVPGEATGAVLVVEHLLHRIDVAIAAHEGALLPDAQARRRRARWELARRIHPLRKAVEPRHRATLIALVARGRAPSPFCQRPGVRGVPAEPGVRGVPAEPGFENSTGTPRIHHLSASFNEFQ